MVGRYGRRWIRRCGNNVVGGTFSRVYMLTSIRAWVGFDPDWDPPVELGW